MTRADTYPEPPQLTSIGVIVHPERACGPPVKLVTEWANAAGIRVVGLGTEAITFQQAGCDFESRADAEFGRHVDLVLAMGGDGTILRALGLAAPHRIPVLGINLGRLGFLAEVDPSDLPAALNMIQAGQYQIEQRVALSLVTMGIGESEWTDVAYNDVVLSRPTGKGPIALAVYVDEVLFARYVADALMISTPTGSTAYNFSAGGPIVSPRASAFLVTPVAPHAVFNRTLVVHPDEKVRVEVVEQSAEVTLEVDGQTKADLPPGARLKVARSADSGLVVRLGQTNFYQRARTKLRLGDPPLLMP